MADTRYKFDELGWYHFECLSQSILINKFAIGIEAWGGSGDFGRDAYFRGVIPVPDSASLQVARTFVFQAKFVTGANGAGARPSRPLQEAIRAEVTRLSLREKPDCYVLMTNVSLTARLRGKIEQDLKRALPEVTIVTWGAAELSAMLDELPEIRLAFPQLLSIRDLRALIRQTLDRSSHERSASMMERAAEEALSFVRTNAYYEARETLARHHMVVLAGPPEVGKTTIAYAIAFEQAACEWEAFSVRTPDEFLNLWKRESSQIFVADDAFGSTEYRPGISEEWAEDLDTLLRRLDDRHWFIWTSRPAPLAVALRKMHLQGAAERFPDPGQLFVSARDLSVLDKALMLYLHAKCVELDENCRAIVRTNAQAIVKDPNFTPKRVQRFVRETLPAARDCADLPRMIQDEMRAPTKAMRQSFDALPEACKAFLVAALDGPNVRAAFERHKPDECVQAAEEIEGLLSGHFVTNRTPEDRMWGYVVSGRIQKSVSWTHPSWRDLIIEYVAVSRTRRQRFLSRCGVVGLELALSRAGGASGERLRPFLQTDDDWQVLGRRLPGLIGELDDEDGEDGEEVRDLLAMMKDCLLGGDNESHAELLNNWARQVLHDVCALWGQGAQPIEQQHLRLFWELSECVRPLCAGPDLSATWEEWISQASREIPDRGWDTGFAATKEWLEGAQLIAMNEPRFLRQSGFPTHYQGLAEQLLAECEDYFERKPELDYYEDYETEVEQLQPITAIANAVCGAFPELHERATALARSAAERQMELEREMDGRDLPYRPRQWPLANPGRRLTAPRRHVDEVTIDIDMLFSEL